MTTLQNQTIKALRALAKERGLKRYSHLRKAELVAMLQPNIMDESVPDIGVTPLIPSGLARGVGNAVASLRDMTGRAVRKVKKGLVTLRIR